jgi:hypothetical protein
LLVVQGLLVNAYVGVRQDRAAANGLAVAGILLTLSAFVMLYKSYQARGYLHFLGAEAKRGQLPEAYLRLDGWPSKRIKYWRSNVWLCPWLARAGDVLEPYFSLPSLIVSAWLFLLLQWWLPLHAGIVLGVAMILAAGMFACFAWCGCGRRRRTRRSALQSQLSSEPATARAQEDLRHVKTRTGHFVADGSVDVYVSWPCATAGAH